MNRRSAKLVPAPADGVLPDGFFVTSNRRTWVALEGQLVEVRDIRMDCCIVVDPSRGEARCVEPRKVRRGMLVVVGREGVVEEGGFRFMGESASSERPAHAAARDVARMIVEAKGRGERVFVVAGPAVIHSGGREALAELVRRGLVDVLIAGNGFAVHDIEASLYGTSLGMSLSDGRYVDHSHHMWAINVVRRCGSIRAAVELGLVRDGVMYECVRRGVKCILVGSIRDDGPLPDTIMDMLAAQDAVREEVRRGVGLVLCLATMLLTIGVCNMLPHDVRVVVVDINPAVVAKVHDRGSLQAVGVVTDVGLFLRELVRALDSEAPSQRTHR